jgi:hypothetical protein
LWHPHRPQPWCSWPSKVRSANCCNSHSLLYPSKWNGRSRNCNLATLFGPYSIWTGGRRLTDGHMPAESIFSR